MWKKEEYVDFAPIDKESETIKLRTMKGGKIFIKSGIILDIFKLLDDEPLIADSFHVGFFRTAQIFDTSSSPKGSSSSSSSLSSSSPSSSSSSESSSSSSSSSSSLTESVSSTSLFSSQSFESNESTNTSDYSTSSFS